MAIKNLEEMLAVGGKTNSLGRVDDVIDKVLDNKALVSELYNCMSSEDAWVRMRAADAFEKVCREKPEWIEPYINRMQNELHGADQQASIQWHLAQMYRQVKLTPEQKKRAIQWLASRVSTTNVDWIVAANVMEALVYFTKRGDFTEVKLTRLLKVQTNHKSKSVVKKAGKLINELN